MRTDAPAEADRVSALGHLRNQLQAALDRSEAIGEFLLAAQIALALDTVAAALGTQNHLLEPGNVGTRVG